MRFIIILFITLVFLFQNLYSQSKIGKIIDTDGYTNIRSMNSAKSDILSTLKTEEQFTYFENSTTNWWIILTKNNLIGFIHKSRIKYLKDGFILDGKTYKENLNLSFKSYSFGKNKIDLFQFSSLDGNPYSCKAFIRVFHKKNIKSEKLFKSIDAVGGLYGLGVPKKQALDRYFILTKYGDYGGSLLIVEKDGSLKEFSGGFYFITKDQKYLITPWYSDLFGFTLINLNNLSKKSYELDFEIKEWIYKDGNYFASIFNSPNEYIQLNLTTLSYKKIKNKNLVGEKMSMTKFENCECK